MVADKITVDWERVRSYCSHEIKELEVSILRHFLKITSN